MDLFSTNLYDQDDVNLYDVTINCQELTKLVDLIQHSKLRLTGPQCDQKIEHWHINFQNWLPAGDSCFVP